MSKGDDIMTFPSFLPAAGIVLAGCLLVILIICRKKRLPYEAKPLLTKREYAFYRLLKTGSRRQRISDLSQR